MSRSPLRRAAALAAALALTVPALAATALAPAPSAAPALAAAVPLPDDPPGGKSVVGETSPIHDPALVVAEDGTWYVFSTGLVNRENGGTIQIWSSADAGTTWSYRGTVWDEIPAWIDEHFADGELPGNLWAPEVYEHDGTYYLYYSASRFGTDMSVTALATNSTLDPADPDYAWVDQGPVISSPVTGLPDGKVFNAIDAGIVEDSDGTPYLAIGSFWYGIFLVPIEWPSGKPVDGWQQRTVHLADRMLPGNPIEAPYIVARDGFFYLFVSFGHCCRGADSTYQVAVGRADSVTGPYLDAEGRDLADGGGTIVLDAHGAVVGPGGQSVFGDYLAFHYYDASNTAIPYFPTLGLQKLTWVDGWPVADQTVELPAFATPPADATAAPGEQVALVAGVTGSPRPVVTWQTSADAGASWQDVPEQPVTEPVGAAPADGPVALAAGNAATSTLTVPAQDGLLVRATAHNAHGTATSAAATVTVSTVVPGAPGAPAVPGAPVPGVPAPAVPAPGAAPDAAGSSAGARDRGAGSAVLAATGAGPGPLLAVAGGLLGIGTLAAWAAARRRAAQRAR
jgi:arabinan endo-1,5-alpha-L-arabinosidase